MASPPFTTLLEQLTGSMGVVHSEGATADAEHTVLERIVWIPAEPGFSVVPIHYQPDPNAEAIGALAESYDVSIYGGSLDRLRQLFKDLVAWLDILCGPPQGGAEPEDGDGYAVLPSKPAPRSGDPTTVGWGVVARVTLKSPIFRRHFPLERVTGVALGVIATGPGGTNPSTVVNRG